jgi:hypothetical protein
MFPFDDTNGVFTLDDLLESLGAWAGDNPIAFGAKELHGLLCPVLDNCTRSYNKHQPLWFHATTSITMTAHIH